MTDAIEGQIATPPPTPSIAEKGGVGVGAKRGRECEGDERDGAKRAAASPSSNTPWLMLCAATAAQIVAELFPEGPADAQGLDTDRQRLLERVAAHLHNEALSCAEMLAWITALARVVSRIHPSSPLVAAILAPKKTWWSRDTSLMIEFRILLENLASVNQAFVVPILRMLVHSMRQGTVSPAVGGGVCICLPGVWVVTSGRPDESQASLSTKFDHIHAILASILRLVPSAPALLTPLLHDHYPHKTESLRDNMWFLKNVMRITHFAPVLLVQAWELALDKLVAMDADIQSSLENLDDEAYDAVFKECFQFNEDMDHIMQSDDDDVHSSTRRTFAAAGKHRAMTDLDDGELSMNTLYETDSDDSDSDDESDARSDTSSTSTSTDDSDAFHPIVTDFREMATKLDSALHFLLHEITRFHAAHVADPELLDSFFAALLHAFERTLLPTHRCRYVQFLYFHGASLDARWRERFAVLLVQRAFDATAPALLRVAAVSFLSGFVGRARFLERAFLVNVVKVLTCWAVRYVEEHETAHTSPNLKRDGVFYHVVQAILYIFCFRWRELVRGEEGDAGPQLPVEMQGFQRIVISRFAPLQMCTKSIVSEFARITHKLDILYCYTLMRRADGTRGAPVHENDPACNASSHSSADLTATQRQTGPPSVFVVEEAVEAVFPFDPCHLRLTRGIIATSYAEWQDDDEDEIEAGGLSAFVGGGLVGSRSFETDVTEMLASSLDHVLGFHSLRDEVY
ncbi:RNA polymerase I-specific transcription initiation factor RRN3 [Chytriomyces sp. MP71]|nr:RNA polymerase I-specific transcription initiation factor RRN3 [Chytriomyces sp. MP71]